MSVASRCCQRLGTRLPREHVLCPRSSVQIRPLQHTGEPNSEVKKHAIGLTRLEKESFWGNSFSIVVSAFGAVGRLWCSIHAPARLVFRAGVIVPPGLADGVTVSLAANFRYFLLSDPQLKSSKV